MVCKESGVVEEAEKMKIRYSLGEVKAAKGKLQSLANRLLLEPIFDRTTWVVANFTRLTPNELSVIGFLFGIGAALLFFYQQFILGAIAFELMNLFDTLDGRIARLKKKGSVFGMYVDSYLGFWITFFMAFGLFVGLYQKFQDPRILFLGFWVYFFLIIHFVEANVAGYIMGGSKTYMEKVTKEKTPNLLGKLRAFLLKHGLREPFNMTDAEHLLFFLAPVTGLYYPIFFIGIAGLAINSAVWYFMYRGLLRTTS